ncbi:MAG: circularly permuted type 2 ATP-grasp protein [Parvibaculaceae bacterium]|nr:circularly permuted type 2 ATP-grasp protein [Parvibaculaceae bacterium]
MPTDKTTSTTGKSPDVSQILRVADPATAGHYDELRQAGGLRPQWARFFEQSGLARPGEFDRRADDIAAQVRENGITYNIYAETGGHARPWPLDLLPFIIEEDDWARIAAGVAERAALLEQIMGDIYGEQTLLKEGFLPPALVQGHPGYLRPLIGAKPPGGTHLHIAAFDLARDEQGEWWVVSQRTQAPSGLGYLLENRLIVSQLFPTAFRDLNVQRIASAYRHLLDRLKEDAPNPDPDEPTRIVLLTPGPYNETYFEHVYLAHYLGIPLVEGSDLSVREDRLFLNTMYGLEPVHAVLRRLDDDFCDPLELRSGSSLGVPGLVQAMRAGNVLVANALGSSFLESTAIHGFLPGIARRLTGKELSLPSLPSWWCGERAALEAVLPDLGKQVIKATYPGSAERPSFEPVIGAGLSEEQRAHWRGRIASDPDAYTLQTFLPLSQSPTWDRKGRIVPRGTMVRVFAISTGKGEWEVLPGGLTRIAAAGQNSVSMQRGGSSLDTWVRTQGPVDTFSMLPGRIRPEDIGRGRRLVSSRSAENLFWMGRYSERAENGMRLARTAIQAMTSPETPPPSALASLHRLCLTSGLVPYGTPSPGEARDIFLRSLLASLTDANAAMSVRFCLTSLVRTADHVRDRLSSEHWRLVLQTRDGFVPRPTRRKGMPLFTPAEALVSLDRLGMELAGLTGAQTDRMVRDDGWRMLTIGRQIERLSFFSSALEAVFGSDSQPSDEALDFLLTLFDSTITYRAYHQRRLQVPPLIDLVVLDPNNPRSIYRVLKVIHRQVEKLPDSAAGASADLLAGVPPYEPTPSLSSLCSRDLLGGWSNLLELTGNCASAARMLSDEIGLRYLSHTQGGESAYLS